MPTQALPASACLSKLYQHRLPASQHVELGALPLLEGGLDVGWGLHRPAVDRPDQVVDTNPGAVGT